MTVQDAERAIVNAVAIVHELEKRYLVALKGLAEAQKGISAPPDGGPSGAPGSRPPTGAFPNDRNPEEQPRLDLTAIEQHSKQLLAHARGLYDRLGPYHRLGLPRTAPERAPTKEERLAAEGESIDDERLCQSCIRIGAESFRQQRLKLCSWCYGIVNEYGPMWPQMTMPPVELVRLHHEAVMGRTRISQQEVVRRLTIAFGTPRKIPATIHQ